METQKHSYIKTILESHLDTFGHVNHAVYLELLEEARWDLVTQNGYGLRKVQETGIGPVILEVNIRYFKELVLRQKINIETSLASYEKRIGIIHHDILDEEGKICCSADLKIGLFDLKMRKLIAPTPEWLRAIGVSTNQSTG
jgi:acyl-CoA thioester hydrolase